MGNASTYRNWASQILAKQSSSTSSHLGNRKSASSVLSPPHLCLNWDCQLKDWADSILWPIILLTWCSAVGLESLLEQLVENVEELTTSRECTSIVQIVITCEVMKMFYCSRIIKVHFLSLGLSNIPTFCLSPLLRLPKSKEMRLLSWAICFL